MLNKRRNELLVRNIPPRAIKQLRTEAFSWLWHPLDEDDIIVNNDVNDKDEIDGNACWFNHKMSSKTGFHPLQIRRFTEVKLNWEGICQTWQKLKIEYRYIFHLAPPPRVAKCQRYDKYICVKIERLGINPLLSIMRPEHLSKQRPPDGYV